MPGVIRIVALLAILGILAVVPVGRTVAQQSVFDKWPAGASPREVGKRVAENFLQHRLGFESERHRPSVEYPEVCTWYGSLTFAELDGDDALKTRLILRFDTLVTTHPDKFPARAHVDDRVFGAVPLQIYLLTKDSTYLKIGNSLAEQQWERVTPDGITSEARYWIDDMYMITVLQVQAYRATHQAKYLDRAALAMVAYLDTLQLADGLFYHASDSPRRWCRGNGWVAAGMTELLRSLPASHPNHARVMKAYRLMMAGLLRTQGEDGLWRQVIDQPGTWPEMSGTGMFAFAMVTGVKSGWLDARTYGPAARKAWLGLLKYLDKEANLHEVCVGTGKAFGEVGSDPAAQLKYYFDRPRVAGDLHGQAPILWTASALMR